MQRYTCNDAMTTYPTLTEIMDKVEAIVKKQKEVGFDLSFDKVSVSGHIGHWYLIFEFNLS